MQEPGRLSEEAEAFKSGRKGGHGGCSQLVPSQVFSAQSVRRWLLGSTGPEGWTSRSERSQTVWKGLEVRKVGLGEDHPLQEEE